MRTPPAEQPATDIVWDSRYGRIVIHIEAGQVWVNGSWVEPAPGAEGG